MVIDVAKVLSQDIISRSRARGLKAYIEERELTDVILDFKDMFFYPMNSLNALLIFRFPLNI